MRVERQRTLQRVAHTTYRCAEDKQVYLLSPELSTQDSMTITYSTLCAWWDMGLVKASPKK